MWSVSTLARRDGVTVGLLMAAVPLGTVIGALAGLLGLCAAAVLRMNWAQLRGEVLATQRS